MSISAIAPGRYSQTSAASVSDVVEGHVVVARSLERLVKVSPRRVRDRHLHLVNGEFQFHPSGPRGDARGQCDRWKHRTFHNEIDFAGPEGLDLMKVDNIKPQWFPLSFTFHVVGTGVDVEGSFKTLQYR